MRFTTFVIATLVVAMGGVAYAELQNVEVNGSIRIRGNVFEMDDAINFGDTSFVEQRTRLGVTADFTDEVSLMIEVDSYDVWGEDFRSVPYLTGLDGRGATADDVEMYQAYIDVEEMWGTPLHLRVGRQEISLGSEWLVGVNDASSLFTGLSFDAIRLDYVTDIVSISAIAAKLADTLGDFGEDDVNFYVLYGSYLGLEDVVLDAYWMYIQDDEVLIGEDVDLHTVGLRGAGTVGAFDFEAELAYQFGEIDQSGWCADDIDFDAFGGNLELGYTFDAAWQPRLYAGFAYLEGGDDDDMPFNRIFSNWEYSEFLENTAMSNVLVYRLGVSAMPTECLSLLLAVTYIEADETWDRGWWLCSDESDDDMGIEVGLYGDYQYSEDLVFRAGWAHFFADDGVGDANFITNNGLGLWAGDDDDDYDYLFLETEISF